MKFLLSSPIVTIGLTTILVVIIMLLNKTNDNYIYVIWVGMMLIICRVLYKKLTTKHNPYCWKSGMDDDESKFD